MKARIGVDVDWRNALDAVDHIARFELDPKRAFKADDVVRLREIAAVIEERLLPSLEERET